MKYRKLFINLVYLAIRRLEGLHIEIIEEWSGHCRKSSGKQKGQIEAASWGNIIVFDVKQRKFFFHLLATIQIFNPRFINTPCDLWRGIHDFPFYIVELVRAEVKKKAPLFNIKNPL
jgi:hypothetical protein